MKYLLVLTFLFTGINSSAQVFDMYDTERGFWGWLFNSRHEHCALDDLQEVEHVKLRGLARRGQRGEAVYAMNTVAKVFLEVEYNSKYESISSLTCRGRNKLNYKRQILSLEQEVRTSYRNIVATLKSKSWEEYDPIANNAALIDDATHGQYIGVLLTVTDRSCELRAYTAHNSDIKDLRESTQHSSKGLRNFETRTVLDSCVVQPHDVQVVMYQLAELVHRGPQDPNKDMPLVPKGPPALKKHL